MMTKTATSLLCLSFVILASCTSTQYKPRGDSIFSDDTGYSEVRIDTNTYQVDYECDDDTPNSVCESYLLRRCAELTRNSDYDYFIIVSKSSMSKDKSQNIPGRMETINTGSGKDRKSDYVYHPGYTINARDVDISATIKMYKGNKPADNPNTYDANEVLSHTKTAK